VGGEAMNDKTRSRKPRHSPLGALRAYNRNMEHVVALDFFVSKFTKAATVAASRRA
jgi:hypothetical protein